MTIYFLRDPATNCVKIGYTSRTARRRQKALQTGHSRKLKIEWHGPGTIEQEAALHELFAESRRVGEWFADSELMRLVMPFLRAHGVQWVLDQPKNAWLTYTPIRGLPVPMWHLLHKDRPKGMLFWPQNTPEGHDRWVDPGVGNTPPFWRPEAELCF